MGLRFKISLLCSPYKPGGGCSENCKRVVSNLSFTATFSKHKPLIFLEKVGGLWFLVSGKEGMGTIWEYRSILSAVFRVEN
jgi:hypothetical protein